MPPGVHAQTAAAAPVDFTEETAARGLVEPLKGMYAHAAAFGDVNRDGWQDLFVGTFASYPDANYQVRGATGPSTDRLLLGGRRASRLTPASPERSASPQGRRSPTSTTMAGRTW